jgi:type I restriction enzyme S subunit
MELKNKQGYKQTEVGLIPEDWKLVPFDEIFTFYSTSNYSKAQMSEDDEVGCIHYGLIHAITNTKYDLKHGIKYYITSEQAKYEFVRDGDVVMVDASEDLEGVNKSVEVFGVGSNKYISGLHTYLLRDKKSLLADNFRGIILNSQSVKNQMLQLAVGMKVFGVSKTQLIKVKLPLPPTLTEQKAIATALSDVDVLISSLERGITKKKAIKQGAMQELLTGKTRVKGFEGSGRYKQTEVGVIPDDWRTFNVGSLTNTSAGGTPSTRVPSYWGGNIPWMNSGELNLKQVYDVENRITEEGLANSSTKYIPKYSILIGLAGQGKTRGTAALNHIKLCTNQSIAAIYPSKKFDSFFLYFYIDSQYDELRKLSTGDGGRGGLNLSIIKSIKIPLPPTLTEQKAIAQILSEMDAEIAQLETKKEKYQAIKQGMMQELLTGKTRLV